MKKLLIAVAVLSLGMTACNNTNNTNNTTEEAVVTTGKVAFFNVDQVVAEYQFAKDKQVEFQAKYDAATKKLTANEKAIEKDPENMEKLLEKAAEFDKNRRRKGVSIWSFGSRNTIGRAFCKGLIALLGIPYFAFAAIASLPMWLVFEILRGKLRDRAFHNTAGLGIKLGVGPLVFLLWTVLAFCLTSWPVAVLLILLTIPSYGFFYDYTEFIRTYVSDLKLLRDKSLSKAFNKLVSDFAKI